MVDALAVLLSWPVRKNQLRPKRRIETIDDHGLDRDQGSGRCSANPAAPSLGSGRKGRSVPDDSGLAGRSRLRTLVRFQTAYVTTSCSLRITDDVGVRKLPRRLERPEHRWRQRVTHGVRYSRP